MTGEREGSDRTTSTRTVEVEMSAEVLLTGERRSCGRGRFVFAAIDEREKAVALGE